MKFSYKSLIVAGLLAGATASCTDKLEIDQHGVQNYDTYYSTDEQIEAGVAEIYSQLHNRGIESFALKALLDGDFWCGGGQRGDNGGYEQLNEYRFSSDLDALLSWFQGYYTAINRANIILDRVAEGQSAIGDRARAEAKVARALMYFELASMWGNAPLVDHVLEPSEYAQPNSTAADLYAFCIQDLTEAISSGKLYEKSSLAGDANQWRMSKAYAQALLGKVQLFAGKTAEAAASFDQVLNNPNYALYDLSLIHI